MIDEANDQAHNYSLTVRHIVELVGFISLPAAILGVVAAFLGWRASSAYLLTFGIEPSWLSFDFVGLVINGWVEALFLLLIIAALILSRLYLLMIVKSLSNNALVRLVLVLAGVTAFLGLYSFIRFWRWNVGFFDFAILASVLLLSWWTFIVCGEYLVSERKYTPMTISPIVWGPLSSLLSSRPAHILVTAALLIFVLLNFAVLRGTHFGLRDQTMSSRLSRISVVANAPLQAPGGRPYSSAGSEDQLFLYDNLRLVIRTDEYLFLFRPEEIEPLTGAAQVYAVPTRNIESITLQQWYWPPPVDISPP